MKMNKLNIKIVTTLLTILFVSTCNNTLIEDSNNSGVTVTTIDSIEKGKVVLHIDLFKNRTIINDSSAIVFDTYVIDMTTDAGFASKNGSFATGDVTINNVEAGIWNIKVTAKVGANILASGYLSNQTIAANITNEISVTIKQTQVATGNVKIRISFPDDASVDYVEAKLVGDTDYSALSIIDNSPDITHKMVVFDRSNVPSGMIDLLLTFKKGGSTGNILGMYREAVNIFDNLTSDKWIDGLELKSVLLYSATDFASTNANLLDITTDSGRAFDTSFASLDNNYSMKVAYSQNTIKITPTLSIQGQSIRYQLNGGGYSYPVSGILSGNLPLIVGDNTIDIEVTAQDYATKKFYHIFVNRAPKPTAPVISITGGSNGGRYTFTPYSNINYDLTTDYSNRIYHHSIYDSSANPWDPVDPILPDPTLSHYLYYPPVFVGSRSVYVDSDKTKKLIIKAIAYNEFDETSDVTTYRITIDTLKPYDPVLNPGDGSTDILGGTNLVMTFWETIQKETGNIYIKRYSDNVVIETIDITSAQVTIADKVLTVNPAIDLTEDGTRYYINIANTAILDVVGNAYAGISDKDIWDFTTKDVVAPTILSSALDSSNLFIDLTFSEGVYSDLLHNPVITTDFSIIFIKNGGGATSASISSVTKVDNSALVGGETQIRVNLTITGTPTGVETIEIKPATVSSIYDFSGNAMSISQSSGQKTTNDTTAPTVMISSTEISPTKANPFTATITFSELVVGFTVDYITVTNGTKGTLTSVIANKEWNLLVTPDPGDVTVDISVSAAVCSDSAGNNNTASNILSIRSDKTAPTAVLSNLPLVLTNQASTLITVGGTDVLMYKYQLDGGEYGDETTVGTQINLVGLSDAIHTVYVIGKDAAGNWQASATTYTWTVDTTAPTVTSVSPLDDSVEVLINANLVLNFSESVTAVAGKYLTIKRLSDNSTFASILATNATYVSGNGTSTITVDPSTDLAYATAYYVQIDGGAFTDAAGNSYAGIAESATWNFTTKLAGNINVTINIIDPTNYTVTFNPNVTNINKNLGESLFVSAVLDGAQAYQWYLDGAAYGTASSVSISSLGLNLGVHNLAVIVTKDSQQYSAQTNFSVVSY